MSADYGAKYYELRCMFKKNFTTLILTLAYSVRIIVIFGVRKTKSW